MKVGFIDERTRVVGACTHDRVSDGNIAVGFIGCGNMGQAMMKNIKVHSKSDGENNQGVIDTCDIIFLTIKPQQYSEVLDELKNTKGKIFVTVAPAITIDFVASKVGYNKIVRTMPNTPALIGQGVTAVCYGKDITESEKSFIGKLLGSFGSSYEIKENQMDGIIALSGSSPALVYSLIDTMAKYGEQIGLDYQTAKEIVAKTFVGSANMILQSDESPQVLIDRVCSKGGTTEKMIESLQKDNFKETIKNSMTACVKRANEMKLF